MAKLLMKLGLLGVLVLGSAVPADAFHRTLRIRGPHGTITLGGHSVPHVRFYVSRPRCRHRHVRVATTHGYRYLHIGPCRVYRVYR